MSRKVFIATGLLRFSDVSCTEVMVRVRSLCISIRGNMLDVSALLYKHVLQELPNFNLRSVARGCI